MLENLSKERYQQMLENYESEQEQFKTEIAVLEELVETWEETNHNYDQFHVLTEKYVDVKELAPTIVNEYIKKIIIYAPDKSTGKRRQKIKIIFNFVDEVDIPAINEPIIYEQSKNSRKTA